MVAGAIEIECGEKCWRGVGVRREEELLMEGRGVNDEEEKGKKQQQQEKGRGGKREKSFGTRLERRAV